MKIMDEPAILQKFLDDRDWQACLAWLESVHAARRRPLAPLALARLKEYRWRNRGRGDYSEDGLRAAVSPVECPTNPIRC